VITKYFWEKIATENISCIRRYSVILWANFYQKDKVKAIKRFMFWYKLHRIRNIKISTQDFKYCYAARELLFVSFEIVKLMITFYLPSVTTTSTSRLFTSFLPFFLTEIKRHFGQVFSHVFWLQISESYNFL
jgi:hypothetical protein